jgi:ribosome-associated protein
MKVKLRKAGEGGTRPVAISGDFIRLDALLKFAGIVQTGGEAKLMIQDGRAAVNGEQSLQRGKKVRPGDTVSVENTVLKIIAGGEQGQDTGR